MTAKTNKARDHARKVQEDLRSAIGSMHLLETIRADITALQTNLVPVFDEQRNPIADLYEPMDSTRTTQIKAALAAQFTLLDKILPTQKAIEVTDAGESAELTNIERLARLQAIVGEHLQRLPGPNGTGGPGGPGGPSGTGTGGRPVGIPELDS